MSLQLVSGIQPWVGRLGIESQEDTPCLQSKAKILGASCEPSSIDLIQRACSGNVIDSGDGLVRAVAVPCLSMPYSDPIRVWMAWSY